MSGTIAFVWADADRVDIRRFAGYPVYGTGVVIFPEPWFFRYYLALEARLSAMTATEAAVVQTTYLTNLRTLETAITAASATLLVDTAAVFIRNKHEMRERNALFDGWRKRLCGYLGVPPGPELAAVCGTAIVV
jgi:hypothetical protein